MLFILITSITLPWLPGVFSTEALVLRLNQTYRGYRYRSGEVSGRLDVRYRGQWGNICYFTFHSSEARVACRQLGYTGWGYDMDYQGGSSKQGIFEMIRCYGAESRLDECRIDEGPYPCDIQEFIVLECRINPKLKGLLNASLLGSTGYTGILEVTSKDGRKAAVCFDSPKNNTVIGKTACGQMGYSDILTTIVTNQAWYKGNNFVSVFCNGAQSTLASCSMTFMTSCSSATILGVQCKLNMTTQQTFDVRLSPADRSPNDGTVEVYKYGRWGVICDTGWDMKAAQVVCRQLGFRDAINATEDAMFGQGTGIVFWNNVRCNGDEQSIAECKHNVAFEKGVCHSWNASGVVCSKERLPSINICSNRRYTLTPGVTFIRSPNYPGSFDYTVGADCYVDLTSPSNFIIYIHHKMFQNNHIEILSLITSYVTDTFFGDDRTQKALTYNTNRMTMRFQSTLNGEMKLNIRVTVPQPAPATTPVSVSTATLGLLTPSPLTLATAATPQTLGESQGSGAVGGIVGSIIVIVIVAIVGTSLWKKGFIHFGKRDEDYKTESDAAPTQGEATTENPTEIYENLPNRQASVNGPIYENSAFLRDSESETAVVNSGDPGPAESTYEDLRRQGDDSTAPVEAVQGDTDANNDNVGESPYAKLGEVDASVYLDFRELKAKQT